jgi:glycosyltransferase involved in cell wall biosynthesis
LVIGGYDVTYIPELDYGSLKNPLRAFCSKFSIRYATYSLPVSDNLEAEARVLVPRARIETLYTGFNENQFFPSGKNKENVIVTVAAGDTLQRVKLKGLDLVNDVARKVPHYNFVIIGASVAIRDHLQDIPRNLSILGRVSDATLLEYYQKSSIYLQLSRREGLPTALCEAMLCECVPIGFDNGGIPVAIGSCGYIIPGNDVNKVVAAIKKIDANSTELKKCARRRIITHFSYSIREEKLTKLILGQV